MLGVVVEGNRGGAAGDLRGLVEGGIADGEPIAADLVAVGVIGKGGVDDAARDACDRMRKRLAGRGIAIGADIGLGEDVADAVVADGFRDIDADRRRAQPVQRIIGKALRQPGIGIIEEGKISGQQLDRAVIIKTL